MYVTIQVKYTNPVRFARTDNRTMMIARSSTKPPHTLNQVRGREKVYF
jgi:hypothetical protein